MGPALSRLTDKRSNTMTSWPEPVVVEASSTHTASVIFLHGLGDSGHGWASTLSSIKPPGVKLICPSANKMPVTLNSGFTMPSWFDLKSLNPNGPEDEAGIKKAAEYIESLIAAEMNSGISSSNIILGGFSQGGALSLYISLNTKHKLGGCVALSCWLPLHKQLASLDPQIIVNKDSPFLQAHGDSDPTVPYMWGQMTAQLLKNILAKHQFKTYKGLVHSSNDDELQDIKKFVEMNIQ